MKALSHVIREKSRLPLENISRKIVKYNSECQSTLEEFDYILHALKIKEIKIVCGDEEVQVDPTPCSIDSDNISNDTESGGSQKNKRGRKKRDKQNHNSVENSEDDDLNVTSRSQRAAAQAAGQKLAQVQSFMKATKLRRPTDFDEKQSIQNNASCPPTKSRKTRRKQSAGSSHSQDTDEINDANNKENKTPTKCKINVGDSNEEEMNIVNICPNECIIQLEQLTKSVTKTLERNNCLEITFPKPKDSVSFNENIPLIEYLGKESNKPTHLTQNKIINKVCSTNTLKSKMSIPYMKNKTEKNDKLVKSAEELCTLSDDSQISSFGSDSPSTEKHFKGFDQNHDTSKLTRLRETIVLKEFHSDSEVLGIVRKKIEQTTIRKTFSSKRRTVTKVKEIEAIKKPETEVLTKKVNQDEAKTNSLLKHVPVGEDISEVNSMASKEDSLKTAEQDANRNINQDIESNGLEDNLQKCPEVRPVDVDSESEIDSETDIRSRTKVIKKNNDIEVSEDKIRSRTKTLKKGPESNDASKLNCLKPKEIVLNEKNNQMLTESSAPNSGELVKKRIEDFEKMKIGAENVKEEITGRVTRHTVRNKMASLTDAQSSRVHRKVLPTSVDRPRLTPLRTHNRITPSNDSKLIVVNKGLNREVPTDHGESLVQKQALEEIEKKRKEDERAKRQAKEETAKKKKEKTLKATAEETRRKREERLQKVTATREASEKEKQVMAVKAEKEKQEKMQQIAVEKEKQREEQLKKKQLAHQKALEHEERRKQEEAARLAKLKEQEEEHKRILAIKEREMELQKQQKAAELRLAEAEKAKHQHQGSKLAKLAVVNNANAKLQQGKTPAPIPPSQSYEITPAREDRPLMEPKSENDYGIDDAHSGDSSDEETKPKKKLPLWAQSQIRHQLLVINNDLPKEIWPVFMVSNPRPDVKVIFAGAPIKKRVRTSSAVWNTPPTSSKLIYK